jgi:hypothetical protein
MLLKACFCKLSSIPKGLLTNVFKMKNLTIIILVFFANQGFSQNEDCGFKGSCNCQEANTSIEYAFEFSNYIIEARVIEIDTIPITETIESASIQKIQQDATKDFQCAKEVLNAEKVVRVKVSIEAVFKGEIVNKTVYILTPFKKDFCGYSDFRINQKYIIYGTINTTADIYFLWTLQEDCLNLKDEYTLWTNKCKRTDLSEKSNAQLRKKLVDAKNKMKRKE